jgi:hypothetical protein
MAENPQVRTRARKGPLEALHGGGRFVRPRRNFVPAYLKTVERNAVTNSSVTLFCRSDLSR